MVEPCPLCTSPSVRIKYQLTQHRIAACTACGFEYNDGFCGGGGDEGLFSEEYYTSRHKEAFQEQLADYTKDPSAVVYTRWLQQIEETVPKGRILDVGSALGAFLTIARSRGWSPRGVEISRFGSEFSRRERGLDVFNGDLDDFPCPDASFDVVTFWDSIEHVVSPKKNLLTASRLLRPGGVMLLTTDNFDCLIADVATAAYRLSRGRVRYPMDKLFIAPNRSYFTEQTLRALLGQCGLKILVIEKMEYPLDKIPLGWAERLALKGFYAAAFLLHRQAQLTVLAQRA